MLSAPSPFSFILFGGSGHLAKLKIYPALYILELKGRLPKQYSIVGYARSKYTDKSFRELVEKSVRDHMPEVNDKVLKRLLQRCFYHQGQYDEVQDYKRLAERLKTIEKGWKKRVRLAYYSVPPSVFSIVSQNIKDGGLDLKSVPLRIIVEKPIGGNLQSFEEVRTCLTDNFTEEEICLFDHYLGKEAVRNIYYLRYANPILERLLKNSLIHSVEISALESAGIGRRAGYYERSGAFRDMFQSHLLQIMTLLTMRIERDERDFVHARKDALDDIYLPPAASLNDIVLKGQYTAGEVDGKKNLGYRDEEKIADDSTTNTYACLHLKTQTPRWQGVPFFLRSGKRLKKKETRISIRFNEPYNVGPGNTYNRLDIILQGEAGMRLYLQTKLGGTEPAFRPLVLADPLVCVGDCLPAHGLMILEAIHGRKQWFLTFKEVHDAWRLVDPIEAHLESKDTKLHMYKAGTWGPKAADKWIENAGDEWLYLHND